MPRSTLHSGLTVLLALWLICSLAQCALPLPEEARADFYIAPNGDDANPGTRAKPFATFDRAQEAVRARIAAGLNQDIKVLVRAGTYSLTKPLTFTTADSGTEEHSITWAAYPGEKVLLSGGRRLTGWTKGEAQEAGTIWTITIPEVAQGQWWFRQLFLDNRRLVRARYPNEDYLTVARTNELRTEIWLRQTFPGGDLAGQDAELVALHPWSISREIILASEDKKLVLGSPAGVMGHRYTSTNPSDNAFLEHALAFLDQPYEWYLSRQSGTLTLMLPAGVDPNQRQVIAPQAERLLVVRSDSWAKPIRNLHFRNLYFAYNEFPFPADGYSGLQAGHYNDYLPDHAQAKYRDFYRLPAALTFEGVEGCSIEGLRVAHVAAGGIAFCEGSRNNRIVGNEVFDAGGSGIMIGWHDDASPNVWASTPGLCQDNLVANNYLHRLGQVYYGCVGIWVGITAGTAVTHNVIHDLPYTGISAGWRWDHTPTASRDIHLEYNLIYNVMHTLTDGGGIYCLGSQPGGRIVGNVLHDIVKDPRAIGFLCNGLYFDQGSDSWYVADNVVYNVPEEPLHFNTMDTGPTHETWGPVNYFDRYFRLQGWLFIPYEEFDPAAPPEAVKAIMEQEGLEERYRYLLKQEALLHP